MKKIFLLLLLLLFCFCRSSLFAQDKIQVDYVSKFSNANHPQIAYWFLTPAILEEEKYLPYLDDMIDHSLFDFIFLDVREGASFADKEKMHPILEKIVAHAHQRNIKVGYRMRQDALKKMPEDDAERFIAEAEIVLDQSGSGECIMNADFVRARSSKKKEVLKVFAFKKTGDGFYDPASLKEITDYTLTSKGESAIVAIRGGKDLAGYTAYAMTAFLFKNISNHSAAAIAQTIRFIDDFSDIPFDGVMLDEYSNARLRPTWTLTFKSGGLRLRSFSTPMAKILSARTGVPAEITLLNMRFAPTGKSEVRIKAINDYMNLTREGAMKVEDAMYKRAKEVYGPNCFIAGHNTFHNKLINDEIWATGIKWWSIPRDNGFSDEKTPTATQMGIAMSYPNNVMYNMYYDGKIKRFAKKAFTDLRYGIRTFYHAFNDTQWGIGLEQPKAYAAINPVENCARLLNRFNPSLPEIKLLVIFGNEALQNWYPDKANRGRYDINDQLKIEEKAVEIWKAGYRNALVPTDLINEGKLTLDANHRPVLNGHVFDAIVFLYPQYAKEPVLQFLEAYVSHGGKLMLEGTATHNFEGKEISSRVATIKELATVKEFSLIAIEQLGIDKNAIANGCKNEDGSFVFTNFKSLRKNKSTSFSIRVNGNQYSGKYKGFAAIQLDAKGELEKFAAAGFSSIKKNGKEILHTSKVADVLLTVKAGQIQATIADESKTIKILTNE